MFGGLAKRRICLISFATVACVLVDASLMSLEKAAAAEPAPAATLTGDWGGLRTKLHDMGIDITGGFKVEGVGNVYGELPKHWAQAGEFDVGATLDTQKLWGLAGGVLQTTVTIREGEPPPGDLLQQSAEVYGRGNIARLTEFWYRQKLFNDKLTIKFGRIPQGDFDNSSCDFMNLTFCGAPGGNIVGNYWYNWPIAQWAGWARYDFGDYDVMAGVYETNPRDLDLQFSPGWFCCATGAMGHFEIGWTPQFGPQKLVGHYQAGVWDDTSGGPDVLIGANGQPFSLTGLQPLHRANRFGFYVQGQQQITGSATYDRDSGWKNNHGLNVFFDFVQADRATSTLDNQVNAGLTYVGASPQRPNDAIGLAVGRTQYNSRAADSILLATPGVQVPQAEYPIEAFYSFQATRWWDVRPDFQYVIHPGGYTKIGNEALLGIRTDVKF